MVTTELLHIGFGNMVAANRILAIVRPDSLPVRRLLREAQQRGILVDASRGRKVKSALIMDNGYIIISALHSSTIARRLQGEGVEEHADA